MKIWSNLFPKKYYLVFTKPAISGPRNKPVNGYAITYLYRKKDKRGRTKFYIDHTLRSYHLMNFIVAKWWMFILKVYGTKKDKLFAYRQPNGVVFLKKAEV